MFKALLKMEYRAAGGGQKSAGKHLPLNEFTYNSQRIG